MQRCGWVALVALVSLGAGAAEPTVAGVREVVGQWVQARQLISATRTAWERDREVLNQMRALHEREWASLGERQDRLATNTTQVDADLAAVRGELEETERALARARELATGFEAQVRALLPRLPAPLVQQLEPLTRRLPQDEVAAGKASVAERWQTLVGILNEVDKFNATVSIVSEVQRNPAGDEVQVETVYLGLAQAWFVDKSGEYAGVGVPGPGGWEWTAKPEVGSLVRQALAMYRGAAAPEFVSLPVSLR